MHHKAEIRSKAGGANDAGPAEAGSLSKAQLRRAQVRRAQLQHRQRKANYVKQLEMDIAHIRDMIDTTQRETQTLLAENKALRARVHQAVTRTTTPLSVDQRMSLLNEMPQPSQLCSEVGSYLQRELEETTLTLGFDNVMNAPCYYISSSPSSSTGAASPQQVLPAAEITTPTNPCLPELNPSQTQQAINFILALEHICRDHFHPSLYSPPSPSSPAPGRPLLGHSANGHTLMATSLALRNAPRRIFKAASKTRLFPGSSISRRPPSYSPPTPSSTDDGPDLTANPNGNNHIHTHTHSHSHSHSSNNSNSYHNYINESDTASALSWRTSGLTLRTLYELACSLNPADDVEITPVQAWFELVGRFGAEVMMADGVLESLKREFVGVVKCPHYGASLERGAFESVVGRVLGDVEGGGGGEGEGGGGGGGGGGRNNGGL
ncbi:DNA independent RNA polymerase I transcription factor [Madurella fahalii]|uniref:DNA independent RNA polymerase I transcription factor n=1 Tax=Madurella fahalii TaxID=1157608 RepID=A0ABQ0FY44_9PEZI